MTTRKPRLTPQRRAQETLALAKTHDTPEEADVRLQAIQADLLGAPDPPDPDEAVARFRARMEAAGPEPTSSLIRSEPPWLPNDPVGVTREPVTSLPMFVLRDMPVAEDGPLHERADLNQACAGALVKVMPTLTAAEKATCDPAAVQARIRAEGAVGVLVDPQVVPERDGAASERVEAAAGLTAEAAIREWAGGMKGAEPAELEEAVGLALRFATMAQL